MKHIKQLTGLLLCLLMCAGLAGCDFAAPNAGEQSGTAPAAVEPVKAEPAADIVTAYSGIWYDDEGGKISIEIAYEDGVFPIAIEINAGTSVRGYYRLKAEYSSESDMLVYEGGAAWYVTYAEDSEKRTDETNDEAGYFCIEDGKLFWYGFNDSAMGFKRVD